MKVTPIKVSIITILRDSHVNLCNQKAGPIPVSRTWLVIKGFDSGAAKVKEKKTRKEKEDCCSTF